MNPWCKEHDTPVMMLAKKRSYTIGVTANRRGKLVVRKGYSRFYECPRCKKRISRGG